MLDRIRKLADNCTGLQVSTGRPQARVFTFACVLSLVGCRMPWVRDTAETPAMVPIAGLYDLPCRRWWHRPVPTARA